MRSPATRSVGHKFASTTNQPIHLLPAILTKPSGNHTDGHMKRLRVGGINDNFTQFVPTMLLLVLGMPMMHTKNFNSMLKLGNGSIGTVVGFQPSDGDVVTISASGGQDGLDGQIFHIHTHPPAIVWLKLVDYADHIFHDGWPPGVVPVLRKIHKRTTVTFNARDNHTLTVDID